MDIDVPGFEIEAEIGRGGFGVVYRARQLAFDRPAAIKVLLPNSTAEQLQRRFAQECRAVGALRAHPNVVTVYSTGETTDGRPYLAMQYLGGGSLRSRIPVPPDTAIALGLKLADGLAAAHAGGVIHRDVKPANVLFDAAGEPVLVDFGISSLVGDASLTGDDVALSLGYTPPEMFDGGRPTPSVDVYSLGATLFAALTGRTPFVTADGYTSIPVLAGRILNQPLEDLRPLGVPDGLCQVIETCMAKDPARRYVSMAQVRAALTALTAEDTVRRSLLPLAAATAVPVPSPAAGLPTGPAPTRRRRNVLVAAAAVLLLGAGVATAVAASGGDDRGPTPVAGRPSESLTTINSGELVTPSPMSSAPTTSAAAGDPGPASTLPGAGDPGGAPDPGDAPDPGGAADPGGTTSTGRSAAPRTGTPRTRTRTAVRTVTAAPPTTRPAPQHAPVLDTVPSLLASETYVVNTRVSASDDDGGKLTYRVTGLPLGVTATADGIVAGTISSRAATVTKTYRSILTRRFTLTVTVTDPTGRTDVSTKVWTVRDTRFAMPNYRGYRGCNGIGTCREGVRAVTTLGPHSNRCKVVKTKLNRIVAQSVTAGKYWTYGKKITYTVGRKSC